MLLGLWFSFLEVLFWVTSKKIPNSLFRFKVDDVMEVDGASRNGWSWVKHDRPVQPNTVHFRRDQVRLRSRHWIFDRFEDFGRKPFFVQSHVHHESISIRLKVVSSSNLINWSIRSGRKNSIFDLTIFREVHYTCNYRFLRNQFCGGKIAGIMNLDLYGFCTF